MATKKLHKGTVRKLSKKMYRKSRRRRPATRKGGAPTTGKVPLSAVDIEYLKGWTQREYPDHERLPEALNQIANIQFDPDYVSAFDGTPFSGENKVRRQAMDKIEAFFKYDSFLE